MENGDKLWQMLIETVHRIERKVDALGGINERVNSHAMAIKWLYGIMGSVLVGAMLYIVTSAVNGN